MDIALTLHRKYEFLSNSIHLSQEALFYLSDQSSIFVRSFNTADFNSTMLMIKSEQIIEVCIRCGNPLYLFTTNLHLILFLLQTFQVIEFTQCGHIGKCLNNFCGHLYICLFI